MCLPSLHSLHLIEVRSRGIVGLGPFTLIQSKLILLEGLLTALIINMIPSLNSTSLHPIPYIPHHLT